MAGVPVGVVESPSVRRRIRAMAQAGQSLSGDLFDDHGARRCPSRQQVAAPAAHAARDLARPADGIGRPAGAAVAGSGQPLGHHARLRYQRQHALDRHFPVAPRGGEILSESLPAVPPRERARRARCVRGLHGPARTTGN